MTHDEKSDLIRELRAEIAQLKDKIRGLEKLNQMTDEEVVIELKAEIERRLANEQENNRKLRALLRRAADALVLELVSRHSQVETQDYSYLIAELREAAK